MTLKKIVTFGEILLRLTASNNQLITETKSFDVNYGGSEANVAIALSSMGDKTEYISAVPNNSLGFAVKKHLRSYNVEISHLLTQGDVLGSYFLENGFDYRSPSVLYNRKGSEISKLTKKSFSEKEYNEIFDNCSIFHISGISFALSQNLSELCFEFLKQAQKRNIMISFDFNYRAKLWTIAEAKETFQRIIPYTDILFCSEIDLVDFLEVNSDNFFKKYSTEYLIKRERLFISADTNGVFIHIKHNNCGKIETSYNSEPVTFKILEKIGSGDAFNAGVLHCINKDKNDIEKALKFGITCFVLKQGIIGDILPLNEDIIISHMNKIFLPTTNGKIER